MSNKNNIIMVSGGFDPIHPGHINMFKNASKYGKLVVILNSDDWLLRKKGFFFQSWKERERIISALKYVDYVVPVDDTDGTVCEALKKYQPQYFGNGGDRKADNTPEVALCNELGTELVWNLGEPDTDSMHSSFVVRSNVVRRSWGQYEVLVDKPWIKVKRLLVDPGGSTSVQYHTERTEFMFSDEAQLMIKPGQRHQIVNHHTDKVLEIIEVQTGDCREDDIVRLDDVGTLQRVKHNAN